MGFLPDIKIDMPRPKFMLDFGSYPYSVARGDRKNAAGVYPDVAWPSPGIPRLAVPAAPAAPMPSSESDSVTMLRNLLRDRRATLQEAEHSRHNRLGEIAYLEQQIGYHRAVVSDREREITAAQASIDATLADIAKLGGKPEDAAVG
ncbi:hypothetical protein U1872_06525 [Sphingomonas sp. RB3P16]|uniref:hypothetical protein n=1 Tax=Parasphingomonas frigoris TaxID=3096163 RepID=UPI002FCC347F